MLPKNKLREFLAFAEKIARNAGQILLKEQKEVKILSFKDRQDIVTNADIASEDFVVKKILSRYPRHSILSEEKGKINPVSDYLWILDPLDGTKEFSRNLPTFNVSLALQLKKETIIGVIYRPADKNLYSAAKGLGSYHNEKRVTVSNTTNLEDAFLYCYLPSYKRQKERYERSWNMLSELGKYAYRIRGLSDANSALGWLSHGGCEGYLNLSNPQPLHDMAAGLLIAREGGAVIKNLEGNDIGDKNPDTFVAVNNDSIFTKILEVLNNLK